MEIWKDIKNYEGYYQISNLGNIKGLERKVDNHGGFKLMPEIIKKPFISKKGYHSIQLRKLGSNKNFRIHRLVAQAFIPNPENKPEVNHLDTIKSNNFVENLEWCTNLENVEHYWQGKNAKK